MSKKTLSLVLVALGLCFCLSLSFISVGQAASKKITLQAITAWPKTTFMVENFMRFMNRVNEKAAQMYPGQFEINYKGGPEVISFREQVEAARTGLVDMVFTATSYYTSIIPLVDGFSASVLKPWEERERGVNDFLNKIHNQKVNAEYMGRLGVDLPFMLFLNKPIAQVSDLKGLKIRCSPTHIEFLKKVGAQPMVIPPHIVFSH